jgi:hypothetical protein
MYAAGEASGFGGGGCTAAGPWRAPSWAGASSPAARRARGGRRPGRLTGAVWTLRAPGSDRQEPSGSPWAGRQGGPAGSAMSVARQ